MTAERVIISSYDPRWPVLYEEERQCIESAISPHVQEIQHIGGTAVPGLAAKPVIDIMVGVRTLRDAPACVGELTGVGYEYVPEFEKELTFRRFLHRTHAGRRMHHVHLVERSNAGWWDRHIQFRDYLRPHPKAASGYGQLKRDLANQFGTDRDAYTDAKTDFILGVERRAEQYRRLP